MCGKVKPNGMNKTLKRNQMCFLCRTILEHHLLLHLPETMPIDLLIHQDGIQFRGIGGEEMEELGIEGHEWNITDAVAETTRKITDKINVRSYEREDQTNLASKMERLQRRSSMMIIL